MKKLMIILSITMIFTVGCTKKDTPEATVTDFFNTLIAADYAKLDTYTDIPLFSNIFEEQSSLVNAYFSTMNFSKPIISFQDNQTAVVEVELSAARLFDIVQSFNMKDGTDLESSTGEINIQLAEAVTTADAPRDSISLKLDLIRKTVDDKEQWVLQVNDTLAAGIFLLSSQGAYQYEEKSISDYQLSDTVEARAVYAGGDYNTGMCSFRIADRTEQLFCEGFQYEELEQTYLNKELTVVYLVMSDTSGDTTGQGPDLLVLDSFKE